MKQIFKWIQALWAFFAAAYRKPKGLSWRNYFTSRRLARADRDLLAIFMQTHASKIEAWRLSHPDKPLPIYRNTQGLPVWMSRERMRKQNGKKMMHGKV